MGLVAKYSNLREFKIAICSSLEWDGIPWKLLKFFESRMTRPINEWKPFNKAKFGCFFKSQPLTRKPFVKFFEERNACSLIIKLVDDPLGYRLHPVNWSGMRQANQPEWMTFRTMQSSVWTMPDHLPSFYQIWLEFLKLEFDCKQLLDLLAVFVQNCKVNNHPRV